MVKHDILVHGVALDGTPQKHPTLLQMNDDAFPARFLQDLAAGGNTLSQAALVTTGTLFQPVQRVLHLAMADLRCNSLRFPRVDPKRVLSAGLVIRRCYRRPGLDGGAPIDDPATLSGWMKDPTGATRWVLLKPDQERLDPDPAQRKPLQSGNPFLDAQLAQLARSVAYSESTSPAFAAPPATCAALDRTVFYAVVPTASSEVSDTPPASPPSIDRAGLLSSLPGLLRSSQNAAAPSVPSAGATADYRWMSDEYLNAIYPPQMSSDTPPVPSVNPAVPQFQQFSLALRMLQSVFRAFDPTAAGAQILNVLNRHVVVYLDPTHNPPIQGLGDFYQSAKVALLDYAPGSNTASSIVMPDYWEGLTDADETDLLNAMIAALTPQSQTFLAPQGRFQDSTRLYRLRFFFRVKGPAPACPPELVWSAYSDPFRIAAWYEGGQRALAPVPLPDPANLKNMKPNCAFQVPPSLMNAMQGASLSGLMNGAGGAGGGAGLGWICSFSIPLITICAFFVLNIFLTLLNIVFFWLPFIKICIPFPQVSGSAPDEGTP